MGSTIAKIQAPLHYNISLCDYGLMPKVRRAHATWKFTNESCTINEILESLKSYYENENADMNIQLIDTNLKQGKARIMFMTPGAKWIDLLTIKLTNDNGVNADVWSKSTGLFPASIPFSFLLNIPLFFLPFADHGFNLQHIKDIKGIVEDKWGNIEENILEKGQET